MIALEQYLGAYAGHTDATAERLEHARVLLVAVNAAIDMARDVGIDVRNNAHTGCELGGSGNGGFRPQACPIGAPGSAHKQGQGIDIVDPARELARWSLRNEKRLIALGIVAMEDPRWTPTWTHWQIRPVASGHFSFIPSSAPALAAALPEQRLA